MIWNLRNGAKPFTVSMLATMLIACAASLHAPSYRYRMTVEIDTPSGVRKGSGVIEVLPRLKGEHAADMAVDGEAVPVDLPGGRTIYALLRSESTEDWAGWILLWLVRTPKMAGAGFSDELRVVEKTSALLILPRKFPPGAGRPLTKEDARPTFVMFGNERHPETVRIVNSNHLTASVGEGVKLRRITLQVTDDPVTRDIANRLPWVLNHRGSLHHATMDSPKWQRELSTITEVAFIRKGF